MGNIWRKKTQTMWTGVCENQYACKPNIDPLCWQERRVPTFNCQDAPAPTLCTMTGPMSPPFCHMTWPIHHWSSTRPCILAQPCARPQPPLFTAQANNPVLLTLHISHWFSLAMSVLCVFWFLNDTTLDYSKKSSLPVLRQGQRPSPKARELTRIQEYPQTVWL